MTREAKIGMLTGLGVIVLIGVLLSEYLGDPKTGGSGTVMAASASNGRMAELPVGTTYRQQMTQTVGVPGMNSLSGGSEVNSHVGTNMGMVPPAYAAQDNPGVAEVSAQSNGPKVTGAVSVEAMGPVDVAQMADNTGPQTFMVQDGPQKAGLAEQAKVPAPVIVTYTIASGDNLAKIAKKYYNSSKPSDVQKIVAANPKVLKDANTMLVVGKTLTIPNVPPVAPVVAPAPKGGTTVAVGSAKKGDPMVIYAPGGAKAPKADPAKDGQVKVAGAPVPTPEKPVVAKKDAVAKTYVVQSGDTLEKIAKKLAPSNVTVMIAKLKVANGIKDERGLQVNQSLKVPV